MLRQTPYWCLPWISFGFENEIRNEKIRRAVSLLFSLQCPNSVPGCVEPAKFFKTHRQFISNRRTGWWSFSLSAIFDSVFFWAKLKKKKSFISRLSVQLRVSASDSDSIITRKCGKQKIFRNRRNAARNNGSGDCVPRVRGGFRGHLVLSEELQEDSIGHPSAECAANHRTCSLNYRAQ